MYVQTSVVLLLYLLGVYSLVIPNLQTIFSFDELSPGIEAKVIEVEKTEQLHIKTPAPIFHADRTDAQVVPNRYIVVFKNDANPEQKDDHILWIKNQYTSMEAQEGLDLEVHKLDFFDFGVDNKEEHIFSGYVGTFTPSLLHQIQLEATIDFIESDMYIECNQHDVQDNASWALSAISHREVKHAPEYPYDSDGGKGVVAYIVDTGIKVDHEQFENRASWGISIAFPYLKVDLIGHGTQCAGIVGSNEFGVAKKVELVAVNVAGVSPSLLVSNIIQGFEFAVNDHQKNVKNNKKGFKGSTVNVSIGGPYMKSLDLAADAMVKAGLHVSIAAGNNGKDAYNYSPARAQLPITVGAIDSNYTKAEFSNFGRSVDIFAPGVEVLSTSNIFYSSPGTGTSFAAPHVTGLLSYYLSLYPDSDSDYAKSVLEPETLKRMILKYSTKDVIMGLDSDTPNRLAYNGGGKNLEEFWKL